LEKARNVHTHEDTILVALVTSKIYANLKELRKKNSSPEVFGEKGLIQLTHKDRLLAFSFLFNIADIDPNKFYKPEDLGGLVLKQILSHKDKNYPSTNSPLRETSPGKINARDMNRTLKKLEKIINLKSVEKREVRKISKKYQIKFTGRPSLYQFPNDLMKLQRIYSDPALANVAIKALIELGLVDDISFFLEGVFHSLLNNYQDTKREAANKVFDIVTNTYPLPSSDTAGLNISDLSPFRKYLLSIDKDNFKEFVRETAHDIIKNPTICLPILILFLFKEYE
jgi:hypothetical protein